MPFTVTPTALPEMLILNPKVFGDTCGFFYESFNVRNCAQAPGLDVKFGQDNHNKSAKGVLRGLHYQILQTRPRSGWMVPKLMNLSEQVALS